MKHAYLIVMLVIASTCTPYSFVSAYDTQVDNTANNYRDRNSNNPTAQDQSNQKPFVKTTARLRREIMRTRGLSVDAQNIKIIDQDGYIVLRGPVENAREKSTIDDLARKCCGANVRDELEIKTR